MLAFAYALAALAGLVGGFGLAAGWSLSAILGCVLLGVVVVGVISFSPKLVPSRLLGTKSVAHRAWFASSWGCLVVLLGVWWIVGWSLPGLRQNGLLLDPAAALGWTQEWLVPRQQVVLVLLFAGGASTLLAIGSWIWQKRASRPPVVVGLWAWAPFFWMGALGLLLGVSSPWRQMDQSAVASKWEAGAEPQREAELAREALALAQGRESETIWAHAFALRAFEGKAISRAELDGFMQEIATLNHKRRENSPLRSATVVGVDRKSWCENHADTQGCDTSDPRLWMWSSSR